MYVMMQNTASASNGESPAYMRLEREDLAEARVVEELPDPRRHRSQGAQSNEAQQRARASRPRSSAESQFRSMKWGISTS